MLPNESFLQVLHFVDYETLVLAKLAGRSFLRIVTKFAEDLVRHRRFRIIFFTRWITYDDVTIGRRIPYDPVDQASLEAACRELAGAIGPHAVASLKFYMNTWNMHDVGVIFKAAPPLKYAEEVVLYSTNGSDTAINSEGFMSHFAGTKSLRLCLDKDVFPQFGWTFLRQDAARDLRLVKFTICSFWNANTTRSVEGLVRCDTHPCQRGKDALELDLSEICFSGDFGLRIIELLKNSEREVTFRMSTRDDDELTLDESDYTVAGDCTTTRYASAKSGILVEVKGRSIIIKNLPSRSSSAEATLLNK